MKENKTPQAPKSSIPLTQRISVCIVDAAAISGLSKSSIYLYMSEGILPYLKFGRKRLIMIRDLEAFLQKARQSACR